MLIWLPTTCTMVCMVPFSPGLSLPFRLFWSILSGTFNLLKYVNYSFSVLLHEKKKVHFS